MQGTGNSDSDLSIAQGGAGRFPPCLRHRKKIGAGACVQAREDPIGMFPLLRSPGRRASLLSETPLTRTSLFVENGTPVPRQGSAAADGDVMAGVWADGSVGCPYWRPGLASSLSGPGRPGGGDGRCCCKWQPQGSPSHDILNFNDGWAPSQC